MLFHQNQFQPWSSTWARLIIILKALMHSSLIQDPEISGLGSWGPWTRRSSMMSLPLAVKVLRDFGKQLHFPCSTPIFLPLNTLLIIIGSLYILIHSRPTIFNALTSHMIIIHDINDYILAPMGRPFISIAASRETPFIPFMWHWPLTNNKHRTLRLRHQDLFHFLILSISVSWIINIVAVNDSERGEMSTIYRIWIVSLLMQCVGGLHLRDSIKWVDSGLWTGGAVPKHLTPTYRGATHPLDAEDGLQNWMAKLGRSRKHRSLNPFTADLVMYPNVTCSALAGPGNP